VPAFLSLRLFSTHPISQTKGSPFNNAFSEVAMTGKINDAITTREGRQQRIYLFDKFGPISDKGYNADIASAVNHTSQVIIDKKVRPARNIFLISTENGTFVPYDSVKRHLGNETNDDGRFVQQSFHESTLPPYPIPLQYKAMNSPLMKTLGPLTKRLRPTGETIRDAYSHLVVGND
jgi:hypothetical protein